MKVAIMSHSLVADRQALFAAELRFQLERHGGALLEIYPSKWGRLERSGGYQVAHEGDQTSYTYPPDAWQGIRGWKPDIVLLQQEPYCMVSYQASLFCQRLGIPYIVFTWENLMTPQGPGLSVLEGASGIICGNMDARAIVAAALPKWSGVHAVAPQVGIDPVIFCQQYPDAYEPEFDAIFMGRHGESMKGESVLDEATTGASWRIAKGYQLGFAEYRALPSRYCNARIQVTPSLDVKGRPREQFAPATSVEGLLCGVPLVTTTQSAIHEWLLGCPGVWFTKPGDAKSLKDGLTSALVDCTPDGLRRRGRQAREWARERFTNQVVANLYLQAFQKVLA